MKYSPLLPSGGVSYDFDGGHSVYASYGRNFSSPSTDNLYRSVVLDPKPEFTNSYEAGYRFRSTDRLVPYVGGGIGSYQFTEESEFADPDENVDERFTRSRIGRSPRLTAAVSRKAMTRPPPTAKCATTT